MSTASQRTIETILNLKTGAIEETEEFFNSRKEAEIFKYRNKIEVQIQKNEIEDVCVFCKQPVAIRGRKRADNSNHFYFTHLYDSKDCLVKSPSRLTEEQVRAIKYNGVKESEEHFLLKNLIGHYLTLQLGADNVVVDQVYKNAAISAEWRKPDVLAKYNGQQVAFELQLSTTFLSVIVSRSLFYNQHKIFLLWVFNNFSVNEAFQKFTQKDIFYNNRFNVFVFDGEARERSEKEGKLILKCLYQQHRIWEKEIKSDWFTTFVSLDQITFDTESHQCYFKDADTQYKEQLAAIEQLRKQESDRLAANQRDDVERRRAELRQKARQGAESDAETCRQYLLGYYQDHREMSKEFTLLQNLYGEARSLLNEKLGFAKERAQFIQDTFFDPEKAEFIKLICTTDTVDLDLSALRYSGKTVLQKAAELDSYSDFNFYAPCIFSKGYTITDQDAQTIQNLYDKNSIAHTDFEYECVRKWALFNLFRRLKTRQNSFRIIRHHGLLLSLASIQLNYVVGYKFPGLLSVSHNLLEHHPEYAVVFIRALRKYDRLDGIYAKDKKGKLKQRIQGLERNMPEQDLSPNDLVFELFPELDEFDLF